MDRLIQPNISFFNLLNLIFKYIWLNQENEHWWCTTGHYLHFSGQVCPDGKKGSTQSSTQGLLALIPWFSFRHLESPQSITYIFIWIIYLRIKTEHTGAKLINAENLIHSILLPETHKSLWKEDQNCSQSWLINECFDF